MGDVLAELLVDPSTPSHGRAPAREASRNFVLADPEWDLLDLHDGPLHLSCEQLDAVSDIVAEKDFMRRAAMAAIR